MKNREVLAILKQHLEAIAPAIGHVYSTLLVKFEPQDVALDINFNDPDLGPIVKFFIVRPDSGKERRHTTGNPGYSLKEQNFQITGFIGVQRDGGPEDALEDAFEAIANKLRPVGTLKDGDAAVNLGQFDFGGIDRIKIGNHLCHFKTMNMVVQERKLGN